MGNREATNRDSNKAMNARAAVGPVGLFFLDGVESMKPDKKSRESRRILIRRFGTIGSRIEGSNLFRDYCNCCGQPIRVVDASKPNTCLDCMPDGVPGTRAGSVTGGEIQYHGGRFHSAEW